VSDEKLWDESPTSRHLQVLYHQTSFQVCVIITKIALKQIFMAFGKALSNHCFVRKNMALRYLVFHNLWLVPCVNQCRSTEVCSVVKMLNI